MKLPRRWYPHENRPLAGSKLHQLTKKFGRKFGAPPSCKLVYHPIWTPLTIDISTMNPSFIIYTVYIYIYIVCLIRYHIWYKSFELWETILWLVLVWWAQLTNTCQFTIICLTFLQLYFLWSVNCTTETFNVKWYLSWQDNLSSVIGCPAHQGPSHALEWRVRVSDGMRPVFPGGHPHFRLENLKYLL